ncbi:MAG: hypothetical protein QM607_01820 [Microbacterium sp.]
MRKYLFSTGLIGAVTSGYAMLKGSNSQQLTWRVAVAWLSWGLTLALAIGQALDIRAASQGRTVSPDSPIAGHEYKYAGTEKPKAPKLDKAAKKAAKEAEKKDKVFHKILAKQAK